MARETLKLQAYTIIKEKIENCEYAPGTTITEEILLSEVGASRTPVRDALSRLEQEGLVVIKPKKGILVTPLTLEDINRLFETRLLLEPYVIREYGNRIKADVYLKLLQESQALNEASDIQALFTTDNNFHRMLIDASENSYLIRLYASLESQIRRTRRITGEKSNARMAATIAEHTAILRAAINGNWNSASEAMKEHLEASRAATIARISGL